MTHIQTKKGLSIPIEGAAQGSVIHLDAPAKVALDLTPFEGTKFKLLVKAGQAVKIGQPLVEDNLCPGRVFVSPGSGTVDEIRRGHKRVLLAIVINTSSQEEFLSFPVLDLEKSSKEDVIKRLLESGMFSHIRMRPFNLLANPKDSPKSIFVKATESAPFVPPSEMQVAGYRQEFQKGLDVLSKICPGHVHLVYKHDTKEDCFINAKNVQKHTVEGPHPVSNHSVHIHHIDPITKNEERVWTVNSHDVVCIGSIFLKGIYHNKKVISIAGPGIMPEKRCFCIANSGHPIGAMVVNRTEKGLIRFISGDPLNGHQVHASDFLGFYHFCFTALPENTTREFLHFFKPGFSKFSASRTYASGLMKNPDNFHFTTNQHGEERSFVDGAVYDNVMPMRIPTMMLMKSMISKDFETAEELGILEVDSEDFALATFVCPSKIEMVEIAKESLKAYSKELLS